MKGLVALSGLLLCLAVASTGLAGGAARPTLKLVKRSPVAVAGSHFKARESVRVTVTASGQSRTRYVRSTSSGSFTASFDITAGDRCTSSVRAVAIGAAGDRAYLKPLPLPACMPAKQP
jgi:hypothetical protein